MRQQPLYLEIASRLKGLIADGRIPVGGLLPPELELCEQFSVSRHTMREAIRELVSSGMLSRRQGSGTRIESSEPVHRFAQSIGSLKEIHQYVQGTQLVLLEETALDENADMTWLSGWSRRQQWIRLKTLRVDTANQMKICWTEIYMRAAHRGAIKYVSKPDTTMYSVLEKRYGVSVNEVRQDISACGLPLEPAAALDAPEGSPGLRILRRYLRSGGALIEASLSIYPADRFAVSDAARPPAVTASP